MSRTFALSLLFLALPSAASANVIITEIMYDLPGTDTGREWIEVRNEGSADVDLSAYKLFEANTNHKLTSVAGGVTLASGAYAVIADNTEKFLLDNAGFSGVLFDSAFSLANTTETLILKNGDAEEDSVTYSSESGAAGDGQTLQLIGTSWETGNPTPGRDNVASAPPVPEEGEEENQQASTSTTSATQTTAPPPAPLAEPVDDLGIPLTMTVKAGTDRVMIAGASELFRAQAFRKDGVKQNNAKYRWNFGNGFMRHDQEVFFQYNYPGKYVTVVTAEGPNDSKAFARFAVTVEPAQLAVVGADAIGITVANHGKRELNLSRWSLRVGDQHFYLPEDTIILPGTDVLFPNEVTGLSPHSDESVALVYPNGKDATTYGEQAARATDKVVAVTTASYPPVETAELKGKESAVVRVAEGTEWTESETLLPAVIKAEPKKDMVPWFLGLMVLIVAGLVALFMIRNKLEATSVHGFEIIDATPSSPRLPMVVDDVSKESHK